MTVRELSEKLSLSVVGADKDRPVTGVFCCDLLSVAMARAPEGSAWVTVIGNANAVAVASLTEVACIILAEGYSFDEAAVAAARGKVTLLRSEKPIYETAAAVGKLL
jgi:hypothetical protein